MKQLFISLVSFLFFSFIASAQTTKDSAAKKYFPKTSRPAEQNADSLKLSNRKIYHWKDGQSATPTGHEATPSNGSQYAALKKDTTVILEKELE